MIITQKYAVKVSDDTLPDYCQISREGERTYLVSGLASDVKSLTEMFNEAIKAFHQK